MTHEQYESKSQMKRIEILKAGEKQMTHEELLARINKIATVKFSEVELESTWTRLCKLPEALRVVVELHKPTDPTPGYSYGPYCTHEVGWEWPCPTIQAIEKELK